MIALVISIDCSAALRGHMYTRTRTHMHTHAYTHTGTHTQAHAYAHAHLRPFDHIHRDIQTETDRQGNTHRHTHTDLCLHTHPPRTAFHAPSFQLGSAAYACYGQPPYSPAFFELLTEPGLHWGPAEGWRVPAAATGGGPWPAGRLFIICPLRSAAISESACFGTRPSGTAPFQSGRRPRLEIAGG